MPLERESLQELARQVIDRTPDVRREKIEAVREAVKENLYSIDPDDLSSVLLSLNDLNVVRLLSDYPSLISEHLSHYQRNSRYWLKAVKDTLISLQMHDHYTGRHSARVTDIVLRFGRILGLDQPGLEALKIAGYFHDLGKITINQGLLTKAGTYTSKDRAIMQKHPLDGDKILEPLGLKHEEKEIVLYHHERWDGRGYPYGLSGQEIPYLCRMMALADTFEALTSNRPYRLRLAVPQALAIINNQAATQFDPDLTRRFTEMISGGTSLG
jgi:HD-GYP domain-containing protein (c-di-GMP phosphodiesterase class II)